MKNQKKIFKSLLRPFLAVLIVISISTYVTACSVNSADKVVQKSSDYSTQIMLLLSRNIQNEMSKIENYANEIAFSELVQNGISNYNNMNEQEINDFKKKLNQMSLIKYIVIPEIVDIKLLSINGDIIYSMNNSQIKSEELNNLIKNVSKNVAPSWLLSNSESNKNIMLTRTVLSIESPEKKAMLIIELKESFISKVYKDINLGEKSNIFILDKNGTIISSTSPEFIVGKKYIDGPLITKLENSGVTNNGFTYNLNGQKSLVVYSDIKPSNWYIVGIIPYSSIK